MDQDDIAQIIEALQEIASKLTSIDETLTYCAIKVEIVNPPPPKT